MAERKRHVFIEHLHANYYILWSPFSFPCSSVTTVGSRNLLLSRPQSNIYFYTIKAILPNQELLVWYCKEFATRLNYPLTGEQMLLKIRKCLNRYVAKMVAVF